jgi:membrane protein required for colicin V production
MTVSITDWVLLGVMFTSMVVGLWRGLVYEVLSLAGWVAAFFLAQWLASDAVAWIPFVQSATTAVQYAVGYVVVFVGTLLLATFVTWLIKKFIESVGLRPVDRALGGAFGLARGVLFRSDWWQTAKGPVWLDMTIQGLKPLMPEAIVKFLP